MSNMSLLEYRKLVGHSKPRKQRGSRGRSKASKGESLLALQLRAVNIEFEQEFKFHPVRKWRADFHIVGKMILIEVEGGIWSNGRHTRGSGYITDMEKYNEATLLGYQVIRFSTEQVKSGLAIRKIEMMVG